ncbi:MAG: hypothetical protein M3P93_06215 [Actinomycetota bacterium]|nr:hypothetical protein [Actinomycetota bacterium]
MHLLLVVTMVVLPVMIVRGLVIVGGVGPSMLAQWSPHSPPSGSSGRCGRVAPPGS